MYHSLKRNYGYVVIGIIVILPVLLWLIHVRFNVFTSPSTIVKAVGKTAALSGMAAYCMMPVLSMRHAFLERLFGGMDTLYRLHRQIGKVVFYFIWAHPILLLISGLLAGKSFTTVWNWTSILILSGILSIVVFTLITVITIYAHIKHQKWIKFHRFFGYVLPVILAHSLLANSQIVNNKLLLSYMVILSVIGLCAFIYRSVLGVLLVKKFKYIISEVNAVTPDVTELVLKPTGIPLIYNPGQYAYISIQSEAIDNEPHPFSFTTAPNGPYIRFVVKELGDDTARFKNIKAGDPVQIEGPYGHFSHMTKNHNQVWIAGGVGITPFLSMARSLTTKSKHKVHLFYAAEKFDDAVFLRELFFIRKSVPNNFDITVVNKNISGFVTIDLLKSAIADLSTPDFLICGPPPMLKILKSGLSAEGVPADHIITEEFSMH